ncbi:MULTISPECIES: late competence development ComFB family protein [Paenibacillus]|uniref:Competence protein ComFB n=1 Tax=Paenibacillus whitsoniae TaxID=2496558 RepID=A0A430J587_9BACL|nr:late competence development ComFB family protein [Paenibacillus whitsoniae]RTE02863.1 competence protein ComFB [Paenibacillus whitsoniae]
MVVYNAMETVVNRMFEEFQKTYEMSCDCQICREDVLAIALNKLPPRYTSSDKGLLFVKGEYISPQLQSDIMRELLAAATVVAQNRHHV